MIEAVKEQGIVKHLAEGKLGYRTIAQMVGVSRGTVLAMMTGRRPECLRPQRILDSQRIPDALPFSGPYVRCPHCGHKVRMPCLACAMKKARQAKGEESE